MKPSTNRRRHTPTPRLVARFVRVSWRDLAVTFGPIFVISAVAIWIAIRLIQPAPPNALTISAGPPGSSFWNNAQHYKAILARNGIKLNVLTSEGSLQNLERLADPAQHVDVGFVQSGTLAALSGSAGPGQVSTGESASAALAASEAVSTLDKRLMSLGSVAYVPLALFYTGPMATRLSDFAGKKLAIGPQGSGTRALALALLKANGIEPGGSTTLLPLSGAEAANALTSHQIDAAFLTGDSAQPPVMLALTRTHGIRLFSFDQADAYARRFPYLTGIEFPMGSFDLGKNLPAESIYTVAPTAELVARDTLHPALSDLLIEAAREVHGHANLLQHAGEFPTPAMHDFPLSEDAARYYKSGKTFLYRVLPFWLASLADRLVVLIVPIIVVLIPGLRIVPGLYTWRVRSRIYRWYGSLIAIERSAMSDMSDTERAALVEQLDGIEDAVNRLKMPLAYADQFYVLRGHIGFVRARLAGEHAHFMPSQVDERAHAPSGGA